MVAARADLLPGTLDLIVLRMLRAGRSNGWELMRAIQAVSQGALDLNYGSIYPALRRLEARGWVAAEWGVSDNNRRARYYELTAAGRRQLGREEAAWKRSLDALQLIFDHR